MNIPQEANIVLDAKFKKMVKQRNRFAVFLSLIVLSIFYFIFIGTATFHPELLAIPLEASKVTIGLPIAAIVIVLSWIITGFYIFITNQYFDKQKEKLRKEYRYE
ncbi:DUF485 domain-containing protein [Acinetobacter baumannii]